MKSSWKSWIATIGIGVAAVILLLLFPDRQADFQRTVLEYLIELVVILPAVLVLMALMKVFVPQEFITRHLGSASGLRGMLVAFLLGTLPTGPLYIAFPLAAAFKAKGARTANVVIFLSSWACIKLPQELVELRFMGADFMLTRLGLTLVLVSIMGLLIERIEKGRPAGQSSSGE